MNDNHDISIFGYLVPAKEVASLHQAISSHQVKTDNKEIKHSLAQWSGRIANSLTADQFAEIMEIVEAQSTS